MASRCLLGQKALCLSTSKYPVIGRLHPLMLVGPCVHTSLASWSCPSMSKVVDPICGSVREDLVATSISRLSSAS